MLCSCCHDRRGGAFMLVLSVSMILLCGSGQDGGNLTSPSLGVPSMRENTSLDSVYLVPSASALPGEAGENTVGPVPGPGVDYTSIQEAIDNSAPGDVIYVKSGTYDETVTVNKPGIALHGVDTGDGKPVVSGDGVESTVTLSADGCAIEGFVIMNSGNPHAGVSVTSSNNTIASNIVTNNRGFGLYLDRSNYNLIYSNDVNKSGFDGICLDNSTYNNLSYNNASYNNLSGIKLRGSAYNTIQENSANNNGENGISLIKSDENFVVSNVVCNNTHESISIEHSKGTVIKENIMIDMKRVVSNQDGSESKIIKVDIGTACLGSGGAQSSVSNSREFSWWA
jgi:parallel beta-helix repeat protein